MAINNILITEVQEFYPVTSSMTAVEIQSHTDYVRTNIFVKKFSYKNAELIFDQTIPDSASDVFIGFRKLVCLCIAFRLIENTYKHTNSGLKTINHPSWQSPKTSEKHQETNELNDVMQIHFVEADKVMVALGYVDNKPYNGNYGIKIDKI
jgi:hypothetical protein